MKRGAGHVRSLPLPGRAESGTLAPGQRQRRRRLPETTPSPAPRPQATRPPGPAGSVSAPHTGSAGGAAAAPGPTPSPSWRLWLGQGGARFSKNLLYRVGGRTRVLQEWGACLKNKELEGVPE